MLTLTKTIVLAANEYCGSNNLQVAEPSKAEKKRRRFGTMFTLHALLTRAGVKHENTHTMTFSGYMKTKDRF